MKGDETFRGPFKEGAIVLNLEYGIEDPSRPYSMKLATDFVYGVAFDPNGPGRGASVKDTVPTLTAYLKDVVFPKLEPFV